MRKNWKKCIKKTPENQQNGAQKTWIQVYTWRFSCLSLFFITENDICSYRMRWWELLMPILKKKSYLRIYSVCEIRLVFLVRKKISKMWLFLVRKTVLWNAEFKKKKKRKTKNILYHVVLLLLRISKIKKKNVLMLMTNLSNSKAIRKPVYEDNIGIHNFITHFRQKLLSTHTKLLRKKHS